MSPTGTEFLSAVQLFSRLSDDSLKRIAAMTVTVKAEDNDTVFLEGSAGDSFFIIVEGEVLITKSVPKSQSAKSGPGASEKEDKVIATLQKGDFFGEMALLDEAPRSASAKSKGQTILLKIQRDTFWKFVESDAAVALQTILPLARTMSDRLRQTTLELATVYDLSKIFASGQAKKELCGHVTDQIKAILPEGSFCAVALWNEFNEEFEWMSVSDKNIFPDELRRNLAKTESLMKYLEEKREPFLADNWKEDTRIADKNLYGSHEGTLLALPLVKSRDVEMLSSGRWIATYPLIGLIYCSHPSKAQAFSRPLAHLLSSIAHLSSTALENSAFREEETARTSYALNRRTSF